MDLPQKTTLKESISMSFVVVTANKISDRIADMFQADLYLNIMATFQTVQCMSGEQSYENVDSAVRFNAQCWKGHTSALCLYGIDMAQEYVKHSSNNAAKVNTVRNLLPEFDFLIQDGDDEDATQSRLQPAWTRDEDLHKAHKLYLVSRNAEYLKVWPELARYNPLLVPVLQAGVAPYHTGW